MKILILVLSLLGSLFAAPTRAAELPAAAWNQLQPHPRIFANAARWQALKQQIVTDAVSAKLYALIQAEAEQMLTLPPVAYIDTGAFMLGPMSQGRHRITTLACAYRLGGDLRFLARAKQEMRDLAALPNWYDVHFLDTAQALVGMGLGLDWLHDELSPAERDSFRTAIINLGLRVSWAPDDTPLWWVSGDKPLSWVTSNGNWNQTCHLGLTVGALAIAEHAPDLARRTVDRAVANLHHAADPYAPKGAWPEGPSYATAGTGSHVVLVEALRTVFGTTCDLEKFPGFLDMPDALAQQTGPTGQAFNYGDTHWTVRPYTSLMFWFARELARPDLLATELAELDRRVAELKAGASQARSDTMALLTWDPRLAEGRAGIQRPLVWHSGAGLQPVAVMRSAWNDSKATFVAFKAGRVANSHAHMDVGSFVLESDGVRWAVDLGAESYPQVRNNGIRNEELFDQDTQESKRWWIFRLGPEGHNILRFNAAPQAISGQAEILPAPRRTQSPSFLVDLTSLYSHQVRSARRGFSLLPDKSVLIQDEWTAGAQRVSVTWQWLTQAKVLKQPDGLMLQQNGQSLRIRLLEPAWIDIEDVSKPRNAFDSPNPGLSRITLRARTEAGQSGRIAISAEPQGSGRGREMPTVVPLADW